MNPQDPVGEGREAPVWRPPPAGHARTSAVGCGRGCGWGCGCLLALVAVLFLGTMLVFNGLHAIPGH